jgi:hypothetical protein
MVEACHHTDNPNGWVMDAEGRITGKCSCWGVQLSLVDYADPGVPKVPTRKPAGRAVIRWTTYSAVNPHKCDHCVLALYTLNGIGPLARKARFKRTCGDEVLYLCDAHKQDQGLADGLPPNLHDVNKKKGGAA